MYRSVSDLKLLRCPRLVAPTLVIPQARDRSSHSLHCISAAPAALPLPRGFAGHVARPSRSIQLFRVSVCQVSDDPSVTSLQTGEGPIQVISRADQR